MQIIQKYLVCKVLGKKFQHCKFLKLILTRFKLKSNFLLLLDKLQIVKKFSTLFS